MESRSAPWRGYSLNTNTVPRALDARASRLSGCDTCVRIFVHDHGANASLPNCNRTSGSLRNIPSMLSSLLSFAPSPRMARAPHNISRRLQRDTVARYASNSEYYSTITMTITF